MNNSLIRNLNKCGKAQKIILIHESNAHYKPLRLSEGKNPYSSNLFELQPKTIKQQSQYITSKEMKMNKNY